MKKCGMDLNRSLWYKKSACSAVKPEHILETGNAVLQQAPGGATMLQGSKSQRLSDPHSQVGSGQSLRAHHSTEEVQETRARARKNSVKTKSHCSYQISTVSAMFMLETTARRNPMETVALSEKMHSMQQDTVWVTDLPMRVMGLAEKTHGLHMFYVLLAIMPCHASFKKKLEQAPDFQKLSSHLVVKNSHATERVSDQYRDDKKTPFALLAVSEGVGGQGAMACIIENNFLWVTNQAVHRARTIDVLQQKWQDYNNSAFRNMGSSNSSSSASNTNHTTGVFIIWEREKNLVGPLNKLIDILKNYALDESSYLYKPETARWFTKYRLPCSNQVEQEDCLVVDRGVLLGKALGHPEVILALDTVEGEGGGMVANSSCRAVFEKCKLTCSHNSNSKGTCERFDAIAISMKWLQQQGITTSGYARDFIEKTRNNLKI